MYVSSVFSNNYFPPVYERDMILIYLFFFISLCSAVVMRNGLTLPRKVDDLSGLVTAGHYLFRGGRYSEAAVCYAGSLQMLEGPLDDDKIAKRRMCGLRLALCQLESKNFLNAIARCSEVINEAHEPEINMNEHETYSLREKPSMIGDQLLVHDLGLAFLTRAKCLIAIGKLNLAMLDLKQAVKYIPDELEVYQLMYSKEKSSSDECSDRSDEDSGMIELVDVVEDCILQHPSALLSRRQLKRLLKKTNQLKIKNGEATSSIVSASTEGGSGNGLVAMLQSLAPGVGLGGRGVGIVGEREGASKMMGLNSQALISMAVPVVTGMMGMEPSAARNAAEVVAAMEKAWSLLHGAYRKLLDYRRMIVTALTVLWIVTTSYRALLELQ